MGAEVNVTFDCVGFDKTMSTALTATSPGGKVCLVGMGHSEMNVPLTPAAARYYFLKLLYVWIYIFICVSVSLLGELYVCEQTLVDGFLLLNVLARSIPAETDSVYTYIHCN